MFHVHSASLPSFSIVPVIPRPISAALLANSDRCPFLGTFASPLRNPLAALLCESVSNDCLWALILVDVCLFCAWARTARNSAVRSCIEVVTILTTRAHRPKYRLSSSYHSECIWSHASRRRCLGTCDDNVVVRRWKDPAG